MDGTMIFWSAIGAIVGMVIWYNVIQSVHEIDKRNRYMEAQMRLLAEIALVSNVPGERIQEIMVTSKIPAEPAPRTVIKQEFV